MIRCFIWRKLCIIKCLSCFISVELIVNLIDFEAPTPPAFGPSVEDKHLDSFLLPGGDQSANQSGANNLSGGHLRVGTGLGLPNSPSQPHPHPKDPFDMRGCPNKKDNQLKSSSLKKYIL